MNETPQPPPAGSVPSCAEAGVLGVLPGIIGLLQALETIKLIIGTGDSFRGSRRTRSGSMSSIPTAR